MNRLGRHCVRYARVRVLSNPYTAWKVSKYGVISGPYFPVFGLNTGKYGPEITPYLDTFHTVYISLYNQNQNQRFCYNTGKCGSEKTLILAYLTQRESPAELLETSSYSIKKKLQRRCFPVNFPIFLRTPLFLEHLQWLLLVFPIGISLLGTFNHYFNSFWKWSQ